MDDRRNEVLAVATLFFILTWVTVSLRVYARACLNRNWGIDDSYMVATLLIFTIYLAFQITAALHGTGKHRWNISDEDARTALIFWYLCELLYVLSNCTLKFAIGYFYLRVAIQRWHVWCIKLLMAGTVLFGIVYFFLVMLQCIPISSFWNYQPASSRCLSRGPTLGITYALGAVNACADWTFGILPFFIVWDLEMKFKTKVLVAGILAFAAFGSTGTVVRMAYIHTLTNGPDFLHATTDISLWSTIEPGIGITAGSIATLRPLVRHCLWKLGLAGLPYEQRSRGYYPDSDNSRPKNRRARRRSLSPSELVPTIVGHTATAVHGPDVDLEEQGIVSLTATVADRKSSPDGQILQTMTIEQAYEEPPRVHLRDSFRNSLGSIFNSGQRIRIGDENIART